MFATSLGRRPFFINFNVTTLVDTIERYVYSPYGVLSILDATRVQFSLDFQL